MGASEFAIVPVSLIMKQAPSIYRNLFSGLRFFGMSRFLGRKGIMGNLFGAQLKKKRSMGEIYSVE